MMSVRTLLFLAIIGAVAALPGVAGAAQRSNHEKSRSHKSRSEKSTRSASAKKKAKRSNSDRKESARSEFEQRWEQEQVEPDLPDSE